LTKIDLFIGFIRCKPFSRGGQGIFDDPDPEEDEQGIAELT
jgi:hypothetical protein